MSEQPKSVVFLHIPKTAGSTLITITNKAYRSDSIFNVRTNTGLSYAEQVAATDASAIRLYRGHMPFGSHQYLDTPCRYMTVLREPVDRVISYYYYVKRQTEHPEYSYTTKHHPELHSFIEDPRFLEVDNLQTRLISGIGYGVPYGGVNSDHVIKAQANIEQWFDIAGISEHFDETLLLLQYTYGWKWIYYASVNVTRKRPTKRDIAAETYDLIARRNQYDIELYTWIKRRFEQTTDDLGSEFQKDLARFRRQNKLVAPILRTYWNARKTFNLAFVRNLWHRLNRST